MTHATRRAWQNLTTLWDQFFLLMDNGVAWIARGKRSGLEDRLDSRRFNPPLLLEELEPRWVPSGTQNVTGFTFYAWLLPGDTLASVDWSFTSAAFGGTTYASGTSTNLTSSFAETNDLDYTIDKITVAGLDVTIPGGTSWLQLQNAITSVPGDPDFSDPVAWDENDGPSQAVENTAGNIGSEAFSILGPLGTQYTNGAYSGAIQGWTINFGFAVADSFTNPVSITNPGNQSNKEGDTVSLPIEASDSNGSALTYSAVGLPAGLTMNPSSGLISGTISAGAALCSPFNTTITATDGTWETSTTFNWNVSTPPSITSGDATAFTVGKAGTFTITSSGDPIASLSESGSLPAGVTFLDKGNGTATLAGTPLTAGSSTITLTASNGTSPNATQTFVLTVNAAPASVAASITNGDTTAFTVGQSDTFTVTSSSYPVASWSESGTLPSGITFTDNGDGTGTLSGTPLTSGSATITLTASNNAGNATQTFVLTVNAAPAPAAPSITSGDTTAFTVGQSDTFTVTNTGYPIASLSESGTLPSGVTFTDNGDGTGTLSGTPLTSGSDTFTITASNSAGDTTQTFVLTVNAAPSNVAPAITSGDTTAFTVGQAGSFTVTTSGSPTASLSESGTLPVGVTFTDNGDGTSTFSGTPLTSGSDTFTITASNGTSPDATQTFVLTVNAAPSNVAPAITSGDTTAFTEGQPGSFTVTTSGSPTASLSESGTLSAGVVFTVNGAGTGTLSGTPLSSGSDTFTITASNSAGDTTQTFVLTVNAAPSNVAPAITSGNTAAFTEWQPGSFTVTTSGSPTASLSESGTLPAGVTFTDNGDGTGTFSGTPLTSGSDTFTITASNGTSPDATQTFVLTINVAPANVAPAITSGNATAFTVGQAGSFTVTTTGNPTASLSESGTLPAGVVFTDNGDGTGALSGMPLTSGSDTFTITASNSAGDTTQTFVLTVNAAPANVAPAITSANSTTFTAGQTNTFTVTTTGYSTASLSESGALPAGVVFTDNGDGTGTLGGTPLSSGSDTITLTGSNGTSPNATQTFVLTINAAPSNVAPAISSGNATAFTVGQAGAFTVTTTGNPTASLSESGTLPAGVVFTDNGDGTGTLSGSPLTSGSDTVTFTASNGTSPNATQTFVLTVNAATFNAAPRITSGNTTAFTVGQAGSFTVTTIGIPTAWLSETGALQAGVTFADNGDGTGTLSGTPLSSGSDTITLTARNGISPNATQTFVLTVNAAPSNVAPRLTSGNTTAFTVGQAGSFTVTTTGIPTASLSETGALPAGVIFADNGDGTGTLGGTPLSSGSDTFTLTASNGTSPDATQTFVLTVNAAPANVASTIISGNTTAFTVGQSGTFTVTTTGIPTASLSETGALPAGVTFADNGDGTGTLNGTPLSSGSDTITLTASNGTSPNATQTFVLTINAAPSDVAPSITSGNTTAFTVGQSGTFIVTTSGSPTASLSESGALPAGVALTDNGDGTGTLSGMPLTSGSDTITLTASNGTSPNATQTFVLTVNAAPTPVAPSITSGNATAFTAGQAGTFTITTSGFPTAALSESGTLPAGVTFADNGDGTGTLSGTPLSSGSDTITLTASNGTSPNATQTFVLTVNAAPTNVAPSITSGDSTAFTVGQSGSFTVTTSGIPSASLSESGTLPAGVTFTDNGDGTGTLGGTPLTSGSDTFTLTASNSTSPDATQTFVLTVNAAPSNVAPAIISGNTTAFTVGQAGSFTVTSSGWPTASLSESGTLPAGVTFTDNGDSTGTLSGTPLTSGSDTITLAASNSAGDATQTFVLTVNAAPSDVAPAITSGDTTAFTAGQFGFFIVTTSGFPTASLSESGTLPAGVTFTDNGDGTGLLSGTPLSSGSDTFTVTASNGTSPNATQIFVLTANAAPTNVAPSITSGDSTAFTVGQSGSFTVTTSGFPTASLSESDTLPAGVTFTDNGDGTGTLSGVPLTSGSDTITLAASNSAGNSTQTFVLTVNAPGALSITSTNSVTFTVGQSNTFTVTTSGSPAAALSEPGGLPAGVTFTDNGNGTATLSGTPTGNAYYLYAFPITASNGVAPDATQNFILLLNQAPPITSGNTTAFTVGQTGSFTVTTSGSPTASLSVTGTLPVGITFTDNGDGTGTLSGVPLTSGSDTITLAASNGVGSNATQSFTLTVNATPTLTAPSLTSANTTTFTVGQAGSFALTTSGSPTASLSETGTLPAGVTFTDNGDGTGALSGTPLTSGSDTFTITASNSDGNTTQTFVLTVNAAPTPVAPTITSGNTTAFTVGQWGFFTVTTSGSPNASLSESGTLPAGVTFTDNSDGTGTLSGMPLSSGSDTFTITASNGVGSNATQTFVLTVNAAYNVAPSITSADTATFTGGQSSTFIVTTIGYPLAALSEEGALPSGVTFTDNGNGTATITGNPTTAGSFTLTLTAKNGINPAATQVFTLLTQQTDSGTVGNTTYTVKKQGDKVPAEKMGNGMIEVAPDVTGHLQAYTNVDLTSFNKKLAAEILAAKKQGAGQYKKWLADHMLNEGVADLLLEPLTTYHNLEIAYTGPKSANVDFLQFIWVEATASKAGNVKQLEGKLNFVGGAVVPLTTDAKQPRWVVDSAGFETPFAVKGGKTSAFRTNDLVAFFDRPTPNRSTYVASVFPGAGTKDVITVTYHFDTYVYVNDKPVYKISWVSTSSNDFATKDGPTTPKIDVTAGGKVDMIDKSQVPALTFYETSYALGNLTDTLSYYFSKLLHP